ncbi:DNA mismatch repair protein MutS [Halocalculus aciditolerans]|uniref:DNA mismatch repair protein MutS n=1 Tax=Halocalculus aciditolerans TaxID=1383812 RepID=A0A830F7E1_9EURY|nr:DNA mismatch repair protein MutS [Halocalculus aciditolerans]GGL70474.1 DNA mismatch repair protein MutS [Halocalculus aciditolerans]
MESALGPPEKMAARRSELTPMMGQYFDLCEEYDDALVLFQVGDFYEAFCEAAEAVSRTCEVALTAREDSTGEYPMAGVPIDSAASYIEDLLDAGYRVAVADQVQDPDEASGVVDRAVTRVVTPGTLTEDELLAPGENNFVAAVAGETGKASQFGVAFLDVSTGDFVATSVRDVSSVRDELARFAPAEAILGPLVPADVVPSDVTISPFDDGAFDSEAAGEQLTRHLRGGAQALASDVEVRACGALLGYAEYARGGAEGDLDYLTHLTRYDPRDHMILDEVARESLELFEPRSVHGAEGTALVDVLDETACALGRRRLTDWLRRPLVDAAAIEARLDAVAELTESVVAREGLHDELKGVYDLERLITRVSRGRADARDLRSLHATLDRVPDVRETLADAESERLAELRERLDPLDDVRDLIDSAVRENPPAEITEGEILKPSFDEELAELRATERAGKEWIDSLEAEERELTGIDSLKVGHNAVHGYYIEVTNPNLDAVPEHYQRRQTLKNSERFVTPELKEREDEILSATARADDLEYELFQEVRRAVAGEVARVQALADALATLDVLASLATVAAEHGYVRPEVGSDGIDVEGGRHPVVERSLSSFVPNDTHLGDNAKLAVITGPNMSGKSTYMRQVALVSVLAQLGSFVPAESAELPVLDRVFTRVGASDDIAGGRSTFMVEMSELATILRDATENSLVLLDEVGRGTATTDGLAIAQAITEHLHDETRAFTLFATHHHELTEVADSLAHATNLHFAAADTGEDGVEFDHRISRGAATASYGVDVARAAGVPNSVVARSRDLLADLEAREEDLVEETETDVTESDDSLPADARETLRDVDLAAMTPLEAMNVLADLKDRLDD